MTDHNDLLAAIAGSATSPWAIAESCLGSIVSLVSDMQVGREIAPARIVAVAGGGQSRTLSKAGSASLVSLRGIALYDLDFPPFAFSTKKLARRMNALAADKNVHNIILDVASPGGVVTGVPEAADAIYEASRVKPVTAIVDPLCASAAYWLASQAGHIVAVHSGDVGSIGVFMLHSSIAKALDIAGIETTFISAGRKKTFGNPFEPLAEEAKHDFQADVNVTYRDFLKAVARGRNVSPMTVKQGFGEGGMVNAKDALRLGMIDGTGTPSSLIAGALLSPRSATANRRSVAGGSFHHQRSGGTLHQKRRRRLNLERLR